MKQIAAMAAVALALLTAAVIVDRPVPASAALTTTPTTAEMAAARSWTSSNLPPSGKLSAAGLPFSFTYGGRASASLLTRWRFASSRRPIDASRTAETLSWTDPATHLVVTCKAVAYKDYPTVEWTVYFKNNGGTDTPILSNIQGIDASFTRGGGGIVLHHGLGSFQSSEDYRPLTTPLTPGDVVRFGSRAGRPSDSDAWPYFNAEWPGAGVVAAVGWPGDWQAHFRRGEGNSLRFTAGQERTYLALHPGEQIRTPLIALQFYSGDWLHAQNVWRRWMVAHNIPRHNGKLESPTLLGCSSSQTNNTSFANEANQKKFIAAYGDHGIQLDDWWMDAGWYVNGADWTRVGSWQVDKARFPNGLRPISDYAKSKGMGLLVWFEPERVTPHSYLADNHPEYLLRLTASDPLYYGADQNTYLFDFGNPQAFAYMTNYIDHMIKSEGIHVYRQDFNMDPLSYWRAHDAPDRQGATENHYVTGLLSYWDELHRRNPALMIDSCASGGRRLDLECMRRAGAYTRSDDVFEPVAQQDHTYGISLWLPHTGLGFMDLKSSQESNPFTNAASYGSDSYTFRSIFMGNTFSLNGDVLNPSLDYTEMRRLVAQWRELVPLVEADYFPLSEYSPDTDVWMAWQFDRPEKGDGMVQAFRRTGSQINSQSYKLHDLDPAATYSVRNIDKPGASLMSGRSLMTAGLTIDIAQPTSAIVFAYHKVTPSS